MRLLLDENVSPRVAEALARDGVDACHVRDRGLLGATDRSVVECAFAEDRVLVTANVADFVTLARAREIHAGMILLADGALSREQQLDVLRIALTSLDGEDLTNTLIWLAADGTITAEEVPTPRKAGR